MIQLDLPIPLAYHAGRTGFDLVCGGRQVFFTPVVPDDARRIKIGMQELSPRSRYHRFFSAINELTADQLAYLSSPNQISHVAWTALDPTTPDLHGFGLGRMVGLDDDPATAEFAAVVVDQHQQLGIGTVLIAILCAAAPSRGIRVIDSLILPENHEVLRWFKDLGARLSDLGDHHRARLEIADVLKSGPKRFRDLVSAVTPVVEQLLPRAAPDPGS